MNFLNHFPRHCISFPITPNGVFASLSSVLDLVGILHPQPVFPFSASLKKAIAWSEVKTSSRRTRRKAVRIRKRNWSPLPCRSDVFFWALDFGCISEFWNSSCLSNRSCVFLKFRFWSFFFKTCSDSWPGFFPNRFVKYRKRRCTLLFCYLLSNHRQSRILDPRSSLPNGTPNAEPSFMLSKGPEGKMWVRCLWLIAGTLGWMTEATQLRTPTITIDHWPPCVFVRNGDNSEKTARRSPCISLFFSPTLWNQGRNHIMCDYYPTDFTTDPRPWLRQ